MTREEAIRELKQFSGTTTLRLSANFWEALNTAIKALEKFNDNTYDIISKTHLIERLKNAEEEYESLNKNLKHINEIKYIERPHWVDEATKAHEIRKKRNLVHAKLGIKTNDINTETCEMVIGYLEKVIQTRAERIAYRNDKR